MNSRKICFFGLFGQQNLGNDCTLHAIICNVRKYLINVEVKCICTGPEEISGRYNISVFPTHEIYRQKFTSKFWTGKYAQPIRLIRKILIRIPMEIMHWLRAFMFLKDVDMLIFPGTGILSDYSTGPLGWPYNIFKWSIIAKLRRCKLLFVSIGAGPISHSTTKWFIKSALSLAEYRSYRDIYSKKYLEENAGFKKDNDTIYPDLAFSLPRSMMPECENKDIRRPVIGIGIMDYYGVLGHRKGNGYDKYHGFINKVGAFVIWLIEHEYTVRMLVGDTYHDSKAKEDLIELVKKSVSTYDDGQIIDEPILSVEQLISQLVTADIVISPRYHNIILALMLNKPALSLSYHEKFASLMAGVGLADYCQDIDQLDLNKLIKQFKELEKNAEKLKPYIEQKTEEYRKFLDEQYTTIFKHIWCN